MDDKIIVTNRAALEAKYGASGFVRIKAAVADLVKADAARGIKSRLVFLDDSAAMKRFKGKAVASRKDAKQNKQAIDAIFRSARPEYLMILGAADVVPHQDLANPVYEAGEDDDKIAWGDLPYACDAPYSRDIAAFKGPTRVVGRLPDLAGATNGKPGPTHLLTLLANAAKYRRRKVAEYGAYFGLSTHSWRKSTELSLFNMFGESKALAISPTDGPSHTAKRMAPLAHFINCHGGPSDPAFYGEKGRSMPESLTSKSVAGKIRAGTVAAVECCYGGELYPSVTLALPLPISQHYLAQGAYGYFGSTTIAYGPAEGNGAADLITQYFLLAMLDGASLGRAALLARQRFVQQTGELDPVDLKTLAQFNLLGDPSIHPAEVESATGTPKGIDAAAAARQGRRERRAKLLAMGEFLRDTKPTASRPAKGGRRSPTVKKALANIRREAGIRAGKDFTAFAVRTPPATRKLARGSKSAPLASRYYVAVAKTRARPADKDNRVAVVAKEVSGRIVGYRIYEAK